MCSSFPTSLISKCMQNDINVRFPQKQYFPQMLISPEQYLSLTDDLHFQKLKSQTLETDNKRLNQLLIHQQETINMLTTRLDEEKVKNKDIELDILKHVDENSKNVESAVEAAAKQEIRVLKEELAKLKADANVKKIKEIQKKMTENRFINHEMIDFYQKIQTLYQVINNTKATPKMQDLYKWVSVRKNEETKAKNVTQKSLLGGSKISIMKGSQMKVSQSKITPQLKKSAQMNQTFSSTGDKSFKQKQNPQKVSIKQQKPKKQKQTEEQLKQAYTKSFTEF